MKVIDISHNKLSYESLKSLVGQKLRENTSLISLNVKYNSGTTMPILKQIALCMLKNIQIHRKKKLPIRTKWLNMMVLKQPEIPSKVYEQLNIGAHSILSPSPSKPDLSSANPSFRQVPMMATGSSI